MNMPHTLSTQAPIMTILKLSNDNEEGMYVSFIINN